MHIIDSHCHLDRVDLTAFDNNFDNMLSVAYEKSVKEFLCVCIDFNNAQAVLNLAKKYPNIYASYGLHPVNDEGIVPSVDDILQGCVDDNIIAIGETGLDYFHIKQEAADWQRERFKNHIIASQKTNKPLIIHTRDAKVDTLKVMQDNNANSGIMHCFVEDLYTAQTAIEMGFYISFSGVLTFNSAKELQETAKKIPLDKILVETDSPYLTPAPFRGKPNHPANTYFVVEKLAQLRNISIQEVAETTTHNFKSLFNL
jgi:TatD DNase family protein